MNKYTNSAILPRVLKVQNKSPKQLLKYLSFLGKDLFLNKYYYYYSQFFHFFFFLRFWIMLAEAVWKNIQEKVGTDMIQYPATSVVSIHKVVISVTIFLSVQSAQKVGKV